MKSQKTNVCEELVKSVSAFLKILSIKANIKVIVNTRFQEKGKTQVIPLYQKTKHQFHYHLHCRLRNQ